MKPLKAGKFRQRVQLYDSPEATQDSYGQPSTNGTQIEGPGANGTFAAEVRPLKGQEMLNVRAIWPTATHLVNMRWLGSAITNDGNNPYLQILPRMYLIDTLDGSRLDVVFASNQEKRNRAWALTCEQKVTS